MTKAVKHCEDCVHYFLRRGKLTLQFACLLMVFGEDKLDPNWFRPTLHEESPETECPSHQSADDMGFKGKNSLRW